MDAENIGLAGGIIGGLLGFLGTVIGTYCAIRNAHGPKEKVTAIRFSFILWLFILPLGITAFILPNEYKMFAFYPLYLALPFYIRVWNDRQQSARKEDALNLSRPGN
jgi:Ca2+/Na+ antiporter